MQKTKSSLKTSLYYSIVAILLLLTACNPFYVMRAAYEESRILFKRQSIEKLIADPKTPATQKHKLELVIEARQFAESLGLTAKGSFSKYSDIGIEPVSWIVTAAKPTSFDFYYWWFPIVGRVPYKGYFSKAAAQEAAKALEDDGYETVVRGAAAFSTLGWFNDPVLSSTLQADDFQIVSTVIHEIVHTTFWVPDCVTINESLANFIGKQAALLFYQNKDGIDHKKLKEQLVIDNYYSDFVEELYGNLKALYDKKLPDEETLQKRQEIFSQIVEKYTVLIPKDKLPKKLNNAALMQQKLYRSAQNDFSNLLCNDDFLALINTVNELLQLQDKNSENSSAEEQFFARLRALVNNGGENDFCRSITKLNQDS